MSASPAFQSKKDTLQHSLLSSLLPLLKCPKCCSKNSELVINAESLACAKCETKFPVFKSGESQIPWFYEYPEQMLLEWKARLNGYLHINALEQQRLKDALKDKRLSKTGQKRINKLLQAKKEHQTQVLNLIEPLGLDVKEFDSIVNPINSLHSKVPKVQGLSSYYDNIFRDWAWDNGENEHLLEAVDSVLGDQRHLGKVLTIGSGAGRLSYDLHQKYAPELSVLMDINPLLLLTNSLVASGERVEFYEFPVAPLNKESFAVMQRCQAPTAVNESMLFMFGDGMNPPFKPRSFDTVLTPWLIDIVPQNLRDLIPRINQILQKGGSWVNTGSLAFFHKDQAWCYSEEEVLELLDNNGFEISAYNRKKIPYLQSPNSSHGRVETVFNFCVIKTKDAATPPKYEYLPIWIKDTNKSIPRYNAQEIESSKHLLQAQVLGAIDGIRSIDEIGKLVANQYNLSVDDAIHAVRRIMIEFYEDNSPQ